MCLNTQAIHTVEKADSAQVFSDTFFDVLGIRPIDGTSMPASFGHLGNGYDAQYYGYMVMI